MAMQDFLIRTNTEWFSVRIQKDIQSLRRKPTEYGLKSTPYSSVLTLIGLGGADSAPIRSFLYNFFSIKAMPLRLSDF